MGQRCSIPLNFVTIADVSTRLDACGRDESEVQDSNLKKLGCGIFRR